VLTGDKTTTAIEIGYACRLLSNDLDLLLLELVRTGKAATPLRSENVV
jgi:magnesium-transporting ATPase (P-type)